MAERLEDLQRRAERLGAEAFGARHPHPFLVRLDERGGKDEPASWAFRLPRSGPQGTEQKRMIPPAGPFASAFELIKSSGKGSRDVLHLGRGDDNDLVIDERSISRLHACFQMQQPGDWQLWDAGSRNGTRLNGLRLTKRVPTTVQSGDVVTLGDVLLVFLLSPDLFRDLGALTGGV